MFGSVQFWFKATDFVPLLTGPPFLILLKQIFGSVQFWFKATDFVPLGFDGNEDHSILFKTDVTVDQMVSVTMKTIPYYLKQK